VRLALDKKTMMDLNHTIGTALDALLSAVKEERWNATVGFVSSTILNTTADAQFRFAIIMTLPITSFRSRFFRRKLAAAMFLEQSQIVDIDSAYTPLHLLTRHLQTSPLYGHPNQERDYSELLYLFQILDIAIDDPGRGSKQDLQDLETQIRELNRSIRDNGPSLNFRSEAKDFLSTLWRRLCYANAQPGGMRQTGLDELFSKPVPA